MEMTPNKIDLYVIQHGGVCLRAESDSLVIALVCYLGDAQNFLDSAVIVMNMHGISCDCEPYS